MGYKRIYVRVPLSVETILSTTNSPTIKARTIDISQGGVAITGFSDKGTNDEYQIDIFTDGGENIQILAKRIRTEGPITGFQTLHIDEKSRAIIKDLVFEYQQTNDFIKQLDEFNLLDDKIVDEDGKEIEVTFEKDSDNS